MFSLCQAVVWSSPRDLGSQSKQAAITVVGLSPVHQQLDQVYQLKSYTTLFLVLYQRQVVPLRQLPLVQCSLNNSLNHLLWYSNKNKVIHICIISCNLCKLKYISFYYSILNIDIGSEEKLWIINLLIAGGVCEWQESHTCSSDIEWILILIYSRYQSYYMYWLGKEKS